MNVTHIPTPNGRTIPRGSLTVISLFIGNNFALDCIVNGLLAYYDEVQMDMDEYGQPSRSLPARLYTRKDIEEMFWKVVDKDDYIDLETM